MEDCRVWRGARPDEPMNDETNELRALLTDIVVEADRMRDDWSESDKVNRDRLWRNLHTAAEAAYGHVYPLGTRKRALLMPDEPSNDTFSLRHPHEPYRAPIINADGRCIVCRACLLWEQTRKIKRAPKCPGCGAPSDRGHS